MYIIICIKSFIVFVSLIGLFFGLFPDMPKSKPRQAVVAVEAAPVVDNMWAAMTYAPDDAARADIQLAHKEEQTTARQADDNASTLALYINQQTLMTERFESNTRLLIWMLIGLAGIAIPLPERREKREVTA